MFEKITYNPIELIERWWPDADHSHITYDPNMKDGERDYSIVRESGGDGTLLFSWMMMQDALLPILNKTSYEIGREPDWEKASGISYRVGTVRRAVVHGMVKMKAGTYPGLKERVRFPVACEYHYDKRKPLIIYQANLPVAELAFYKGSGLALDQISNTPNPGIENVYYVQQEG